MLFEYQPGEDMTPARKSEKLISQARESLPGELVFGGGTGFEIEACWREDAVRSRAQSNGLSAGPGRSSEALGTF